MRRLVILALLVGGMQLVLLAGPAEGGGESLLALGFLILAAYSVGELTQQLNQPKIVGYLIAGALFGPSALNVVSAASVEQLGTISDLAIALIAFLAGAELDWGELRKRGVALLKVTGAELAVTFVVILAALLALREYVPFLQGTNMTAALTFAGLFSAMAIVHSPAVTMALLTETGARGSVARTTLGVVLLADVAVVLLFSGALAAARALVPSGSGGVSFGATVWEIGGAFPVGALLGGAVALYLRFVKGELFLFALLVTFFGAEVSRLLHVETLLTLLVAGFVTENVAHGGTGRELRHAMERSAAPVFVIFFALAGAKLQLNDLAQLWWIVIPIALVRMAGIWLGTQLGGRWAGLPAPERNLIWLGLVSQAGVAIGLVTVAGQVYPAAGGEMGTILLAVIAVNTPLGAVLFRRALAKAGELGPERTAIPDPGHLSAAHTADEGTPARG